MKDIKAKAYLGERLFNLYKKRHPLANNETWVYRISYETTRIGLVIPLTTHVELVFDEQENISPYGEPPPTVMVKPEQFEMWTLEPHGIWYRLAYVEQLNCICAFDFYHG
jgi:hypothetical protein